MHINFEFEKCTCLDNIYAFPFGICFFCAINLWMSWKYFMAINCTILCAYLGSTNLVVLDSMQVLCGNFDFIVSAYWSTWIYCLKSYLVKCMILFNFFIFMVKTCHYAYLIVHNIMI